MKRKERTRIGCGQMEGRSTINPFSSFKPFKFLLTHIFQTLLRIVPVLVPHAK
jgi:hypothetical protein